VIVDKLADWAARTPSAPFIVTDTATYTFSEIHVLTLRMASRLHAAGIGTGGHVAIIAGNSAAYLVAWFGINAIGGVAVTLNDSLMGEDINYLIKQSNAKLIVADRVWLGSRHEGLAEAQRAVPIFAIESEGQFIGDLRSWPERDSVSSAPDDICTILYTSGTTGLPKGVMCAHAGYVAVGRQSARILEVSASDRILVFLPLFHTNPQMYAVMAALEVGASLAIRSKFSATNFFADASHFGATGCTFVGTVLSILAARYPDPQRDHAMRFCIGGGTTKELAKTVQSRFGMFVHELYGMTEAGGWVSGASRAEHRLGSNGLIRDDVEVRIVDPGDNEVGVGMRGEIVVRPRQPNVMMMGYYNKPDQTVAATGNLWFHTGDIGSVDADGYLYFHGRSKELIRRGGEMIAPATIEERLRAMPQVSDCAAVGVPDDIMGEEIKVVVVSEERIEAALVRTYLAGFFPPAMLPRYVEFSNSIPRTETEKILRRQLAYVDDSVIDLGQ
jgi:acyl-CoA synthetase (AMP-forming)/AMP-acid ligase II